MTRVTTDPSKKLTIYSRIGMSNTKRFSFFNGDGTDYDLSGVTLEIGIKRPRFANDILTLTSGQGLTITGNDVDMELTAAQSANFDERVYYFELRRVISGKQKVWLNGDHIWHKGTFDAFNDNGTNITIDDNGEDVLITISESGSGGGAVDSVNGATGVVLLDADDIDDTSTTNKFVTSDDITKLGNLSGTNTGDAPLTNGNGTTANGTAVDLGGTISSNTTISGLNSDFTINLVNEFDASRFIVDTLNQDTGDRFSYTFDPIEFIVRDVSNLKTLLSVTYNNSTITSGGSSFVQLLQSDNEASLYSSASKFLSLSDLGVRLIVGSDATGDIYYRNSSGYFARLPIGTNGQVLKVTTGLPAWGNEQDLSSYATLTGTQTLTNKRITQRVQSVTSSATVTANADNDDMVIITAQAEALTLANPSGTPTEGQGLVYRIKDNGTARTIGYGANFRAMGITLPTTTVISKTLYLACVWNVADSKWDVIGERQEA